MKGDKLPNLDFRKIPSLNFLYEVNSDGTIVRNVKSGEHVKIRLLMHHTEKGYYAFFSYIVLDGVKKVRQHMIHHVVAECWLGPRPNGAEIDHIDQDTQNNHYTNLRYASHSEQMKNRSLGEHVINAGKKNCAQWNAEQSVSVIVKGPDFSMTLPSINSAARFLSELSGRPQYTIRSSLKKRSAFIHGYMVSYGRSTAS